MDNIKSILEELKEIQKQYVGVENGMLRISLLQGYVMGRMANAETLEESNDIYSSYRHVSYNYAI